jgi:hypothetical protein
LHEDVFSRVYAERGWAVQTSVSGPGSELDRTADLRRRLPALLEELGVRTLLDAGCGDFGWLRVTELPEQYVGVDVVPELFAALEQDLQRGRTFLRADITRVLCRDVLIHFPDDDIVRAVENLRRTGARWLLTTTFVGRGTNEPIALGDWRTLDLEAPPFDFPPPSRLIPDIPVLDRELYLDKRLGLWEVAAL